MNSNECIKEIEVDGERAHLIDQNGLIIGIERNHLNVYKIDGNEWIKINKIKIYNQEIFTYHKIIIKIKSENKIEFNKEK